jgi:hydrophobic/amphiphilic exporter-1 (mainly G- bacteria), HAE1 family
MNIAEISIKRSSLVVVIFTVLTFLGVISYKSLKYELLPKYDEPVLTIVTLYPGASPSEVENSVTRKIEDAVASVQNIDNIQSKSYEGSSLIIVILKNSKNIDKIVRDCEQKVNNIKYLLPKDVMNPIVSKFAMTDLPVMRISVTSNKSSTELYDLIKEKIEPYFARVQGVAQIQILGGQEREIKVNIDPARIESYGLSILQVTEAIQASNMEFPTGKLKDENHQMIIRLSGKYKTIEDLKKVIISQTEDGSLVHLSDVADIEDSQKDITEITRLNGQNSVGLWVMKQEDANEVEISQGVKQQMSMLEKTYKQDNLKFLIANDSSDFTLTSANAVRHDLLLAIILVSLVMLVFLHSIRNSFIVLVAIPASLISVFTAMSVLNFSLNIVSMVALSLVIGILVDDSIVVLENIYRHLEKGEKRQIAALNGRNEITYTALSITLVDVVVFLPIGVIESMISGLLRQFALVVVVSTLLSLFVSFTVTPLLASRVAKLEHYRKGSLLQRLVDWFENMLSGLNVKYAHILVWSLRHKFIILGGATALFFASLMLVATGFIGSEFVSMGDRGELIIQLELPKDATIEQTNRATLKAEQIISKQTGVINVFSTVGAASDFLSGGTNAYRSEINVKLVPKEDRDISADHFALNLKHMLRDSLPGVKVRTSIVSIVGTSDMAPIQLVVTGSNYDSIYYYASKIMESARKVPGTSDVKLSVETGNPEVEVKLDKEKMASLGLTTAMVGSTMQIAYSGNTDAKFRGEQKEYDINIKVDQFNRRNLDDIANLTFTTLNGKVVKLKQFAQINYSSGTTLLERYDRVPSIAVQASVFGRPTGSVGEDVLKEIEKIHIPSDINIIKEGDLKYQSEAFNSLFIALLASILFVYLIMVALYDSYIYPFVVLFSIPLAIIGALLALALTMQSMNIFSILGIIMLIGLVGKNAILLVDFTNQLKAKGHNTVHALITSGKVRLRPILMTTLSMIAGMLPIALATGAGSEWKNGMAWALVGGLTSSLLLTLVVVPIIYLFMDTLKNRLTRKKSG